MFIKILIITIYTAVSSFGLYFIKLSEMNWNYPSFWLGGFLYGSGFLIWLYILRISPLSFAFPVAAGSLIIATQLIGIFLLQESFRFEKILGGFLVIAGIILIYARGESVS